MEQIVPFAFVWWQPKLGYPKGEKIFASPEEYDTHFARHSDKKWSEYRFNSTLGRRVYVETPEQGYFHLAQPETGKFMLTPEDSVNIWYSIFNILLREIAERL